MCIGSEAGKKIELRKLKMQCGQVVELGGKKRVAGDEPEELDPLFLYQSLTESVCLGKP